VQVAWHPLSESHLAVLTAGGVFRLFDAADDLSAPVLSLSVPHGADEPGSPASPTPEAAAPTDEVVAFSFGSPTARGWGSLSLYFLCADGVVWGACPLLPHGRRAHHHLLSIAPELLRGVSSGGAREWVEERRAAAASAAGASGAPPRWLEPPAVQGPFSLLESNDEVAAPARGAVALALCALPALSAGGFFALGWSDHSARPPAPRPHPPPSLPPHLHAPLGRRRPHTARRAASPPRRLSPRQVMFALAASPLVPALSCSAFIAIGASLGGGGGEGVDGGSD